MLVGVEVRWAALGTDGPLAVSRFDPARTIFNRCRFGQLSVTEQVECYFHELGHHARAAFPYRRGGAAEHGICEARADRWAQLQLVPDQRVLDALCAGCETPEEFAAFWGRTLPWALKRLRTFQVQHPELRRWVRIA